jgi:hypothetical protein
VLDRLLVLQGFRAEFSIPKQGQVSALGRAVPVGSAAATMLRAAAAFSVEGLQPIY